MSEQSEYLKQLRFDPKLKKGAIAMYLVNFRLMVLLVLSIVAFGVFGYINLPRRVNPEVEIPIVFVSTVLPGGNPEDIEELITIPLEDAINRVDKVEQIDSNSQENFASIVVEFDSSVEADKARSDVQSAVDGVNLPEDAGDPVVVTLDFEDVPVWSFVITSQKDTATLTRFAKRMEEEIKELPNVARVVVSGLETQEVQILLPPENASALGVNPITLQQQISTQLKAIPAGLVSSNGSSFAVSVEAGVNSIEDLRSLEVNIGRQQLALGDVAVVMQRSRPNQAKSFYANNETSAQRAVTLSVYKTTAADIDEAAKAAKEKAQEVVKEFDGAFELETILDFDEDIRQQFSDLFGDFLSSISLVFLTLFIFLGIRQASIASLVIPVSYLFTFGVVYTMDLSLNFISIFSLLLAQGMIVDDVIVIISAMTDYYRTKKFTPQEVGLMVWRDFIAPTLTSNLTNVWSFLPLLLATGIIGEFIKTIPVVVIAALVGSTLISLLVTIPLMMILLKFEVPQRVKVFLQVLTGLIGVVGLLVLFGENRLFVLIVLALLVFGLVTKLVWLDVARFFKSQASRFSQNVPNQAELINKVENGFVSISKPIDLYKEGLSRILASSSAMKKTILAVVAFSIFSYALVPLGLVKNEFFPKTDAEQLYVGVELPVGTILEKTTNETLRLLEELRQVECVEFVSAEIGAQLDSMSVATQTESNLIRFSLALPERCERNLSSIEIAERLRQEYRDYDQGDFSVQEVSGGPPTGADLQIKILGDDLSVLDQKADDVVGFLEGLEGAIDVDKSIKPGVSKLSFVVDQNKAQDAGVSLQQVGLYLRTFASGFDLESVSFTQDNDLDMVLRMDTNLQSPESLGALSIPNASGENIPLLSLGKLELKSNPTKITREDGDRTISISATVRPGYNIPQLGRQLEEFADSELDLPDGYMWKTGGVNEENNESVQSILQSMVIAAILIAGTMVVELGSFRKALIVMLVIPLAVSGVFVLFALTRTPLSFPSLIGVLALFGIVVKNSILVVDKINQNLEVGIPFREAVADGASSRLEPIIFSSVTNFVGLIPITISDPLWRGLGGAIIAGLSMSGTIMLFFIPVVYYLIYQPRK